MRRKNRVETIPRSTSRKSCLLFASIIAVMLCALFLVPGCPPCQILTPYLGGRKIISNTLPLKEKWRYSIDFLLDSPMSFYNNEIIVRQIQSLKAINAETGEEQWMLPGDSISGFTRAVGEQAVAYDSPELSVLDASTGSLKWRTPTNVIYSLAIGEGRLYAAIESRLRAYDLQNGSLLWEVTEGIGYLRGYHVYYDSAKLYVVNGDHLYVLNPRNGQVLGSFDYVGSGLEVVSEENIYGVVWPDVIATDAKTGATLWKNAAMPLTGYLRPTLLHGVLYVITQDGQLLALDANTGAQKWVKKNLGRAFSNVVEFNGEGYVMSEDGRLHGFDLDSGKEVGTLDTGNSIGVQFGGAPAIPSLVVVGRTLAFTFGDSYVYGFEENVP